MAGSFAVKPPEELDVVQSHRQLSAYLGLTAFTPLKCSIA
jgi:hypothetical protein